ncbi:uncharacterized protein LOC135216510 [Macrobrachium nipponense]|uniref:uncharacterized protein LOC135216510 n=1 Tax=Macrobrachium nipponense TaxID=159736 RepID=UPI0030C7CAA9
MGVPPPHGEEGRRSPEEHLNHVRAVLKLLQENGLVVHFDKCTFGAEKVDFLGHEITAAGARPTVSKVATVDKFPTLMTVKTLQEFIGMDPHVPLTLTADTSNIVCGTVLEQLVNRVPTLLAFFSKKLKPAETRYSTFDRELLAVYQAICHFKNLLEGVPFTTGQTTSRWSTPLSRQATPGPQGSNEFGCSIDCRRRFRHIHVDIVGPLPPSNGARYLLAVIDWSKRWPEATPMSEATADACAEALLTNRTSRFGVPDNVTTDRGQSSGLPWHA